MDGTSIIEILKKRSIDETDEVKIELKLYNLVDDLTKKARNHLKRISNILPEFDIHDEKHSEKIVSNIESLLGEDKLNEASVYELVLLYLSAFLHDCAMAPSDWEINVMKLTEGTKDFKVNDKSICNDLNSPYKLTQAIKIVTEGKKEIYRTFDGDVADWMFSPDTESKLINYLSELLIEYQNFRNGFADQLKKINTQDDFISLNNFIRTDYIRATHHKRIETYVKNLEPIFCNAFEQPAWGKKLTHDLALICRSHGEDSSFIDSFSINAQYYGSESANLQFVAVMLRLGDIIHFSFDRAPLDLRTSKLFQSEYSFLQWALKSSGVNYSIESGKISFRAYCEDPELYFKLHQYLDWIEFEIQNYFKFERKWNKKYINNLQDKIDRSNIINDENSFLPRRGLSFTLNQKKTIELLMGIGLYKDKFACLRELYQNSLDACRCMLSYNAIENRETKGLIKFYIQREGDKTFLCLYDNGIGMDKHIIETYLLNIGNSYYKSSEFYKSQSKWGGVFTPTSQFGIGILSCFMIGAKIEITTKKYNSDYVSCSIDGPHENFYYRKTPEIEKEKIVNSGTIIKVLMNESEEYEVNTSPIDKIGLLLMGKPNYFPEKYESYKILFKYWENHLYKRVNDFIKVVPKNIEVSVELTDGKDLKIENKPIVVGQGWLSVEDNDLDFFDFLNNNGRFKSLKRNYSTIKDKMETYKIEISHKDIEYRTTLLLPKKDVDFDKDTPLYSLPTSGGFGVSIDGIAIDRSVSYSHYYTESLCRNDILNFIGENRPQLSVDRKSIVYYPEENEEIAKDIVEILLKEIITLSNDHIRENGIDVNDKEFSLIWRIIFDKLHYADNIFVDRLAETDYGNIIWEPLNELLGEKKSIRDFLLDENVVINGFDLTKYDVLTEKLLIFKILSSNKLIANLDSLEIKSDKRNKTSLLWRKNRVGDDVIVVSADEFDNVFLEYDIVSNYRPIIPKRLFDLIEGRSTKSTNQENAKLVHGFSNGITAFFDQDPLLISERMGLYTPDSNILGIEKNLIYNFENKRSAIRLFELNDRYVFDNSNLRYVITVFVSPRELTVDQEAQLERIKKEEPSYYKGVKEGWSILVTSMEDMNTIIVPGKSTRSELIAKIPDVFWEKYNEYEFKFTDGTSMTKS